MICAAGKFVLFCVYGMHSIVWDLESGRMERIYAPSVLLCEGPKGTEAVYSWNQAECIDKRTICSCLPFGESIDKNMIISGGKSGRR